MMRTTPLFDTNVFSDAANGDISQREGTLLKNSAHVVGGR
jgi:hypothetical protein